MPRQLSILTSTFFDTLIARLPPWAIDSRVATVPNNIALATALRYLDLAAGFVTRQNVEDFHHRYAVAAHISRGRNLIGSWVAELRTTWRTASQS